MRSSAEYMVGDDLRERRRRRTRQEMQQAALSLCIERGYESVRVEDIASRAGVSSRTLFRYFPTKEDIFMEPDSDTVTALSEALAARPEGWTPHDVLRQFAMLVADYHVARKAFFVARHKLFLETPALARRAVAYRPAMVEDLTDLFSREVGARGEQRRRMYIAMGALKGGIDAALHQWLDARGRGSLHDAWTGVLDTLQPVLEDVLGPVGCS